MKEIIISFLGKIKTQNKTLGRTNLLVNHPWTLIDTEGNQQKLIFKTNGALLVSMNGEVLEGTWEYLDEAKSLYLKYANKQFLYNEAYAQDAIIILKKDGSKDDFIIYANQNVIPDLDWVTYLQGQVKKAPVLEVEKSIEELYNESNSLEDFIALVNTHQDFKCQLNETLILCSNSIIEYTAVGINHYLPCQFSFNHDFLHTAYTKTNSLLGAIVIRNNALIEDGFYMGKYFKIALELKNNRILKIYKQHTSGFSSLGVITVMKETDIKCSRVKEQYNITYYIPKQSLVAYIQGKLLYNGNYKLNNFSNMVIKDWHIVKVYYRFKLLRYLANQEVSPEELIITEL